MQLKPATGTVEPAMSWLTHNQTIQAIATLCTLAGGAVLAFGAARLIWRFSRDAYQTSFKTALKQWRRRIRRITVVCARDVHAYLSFIVFFLTIGAGGIAIPLLLSSMSLSYPVLRPAVLASLAVFVGYSFTAVTLLLLVVRGVMRLRLRTLGRARRVRVRAARNIALSRTSSVQ